MILPSVCAVPPLTGVSLVEDWHASPCRAISVVQTADLDLEEEFGVSKENIRAKAYEIFHGIGRLVKMYGHKVKGKNVVFWQKKFGEA